ncbi:MAG: hypothetical protein ACR2QM_02510 [Longimicrobiales bacterium]
MKRPDSTLRKVLLEGGIIVGSILLAFGIDAAWDSYRERQEFDILQEQLTRQLSANVTTLVADRTRADTQLAAARELIELARPAPSDISSGELVGLIVPALNLGATELELSALETLLAQSEATETEPGVQRRLIRFRGQARRYARDLDIFTDRREELIAFLIENGMGAAHGGAMELHAPTSFELPTRQILGHSEFEARVSSLVIRSNLRALRGQRLEALADSILSDVRRGIT